MRIVNDEVQWAHQPEPRYILLGYGLMMASTLSVVSFLIWLL
jgi:hypothetical protein